MENRRTQIKGNYLESYFIGKPDSEVLRPNQVWSIYYNLLPKSKKKNRKGSFRTKASPYYSRNESEQLLLFTFHKIMCISCFHVPF